MPIIHSVVRLPCSQGAEKCRLVFELVSNGVPDQLWFRVILREFGDQDVKAVIDSAALVMHDVIIASYGCPNQAFPWECRVRNSISCVPILARIRELAIVVDTKRDNGGWQILG